MNNYLATIAARTLNPAPPMRPRLRGRFELVPALREKSFERSAWHHPNSREPSPTHAGTEQRGAPSAAGKHDFDHQSTRLLDPTPQSERSGGVESAVSRPAAHLTDSKVDRSGSVTIVTTRPAAEPGPQRPAAARSAKKNIEEHQEAGLRRNPLPQRPSENASEPPRKNVPINPLPQDHHAPSADSSLTLRESPKPFQIYQKRTAGEDGLLNSRHLKQKQSKEPEVKTVIVREKILVESQQEKQSTSPAPAVTALPRVMKPEASGTGSVFVPSRIAPRIEVGDEQLTRKRRHEQTQPTVHVTIGRLEVRAVQSSPPQPKPHTATPVMNLDDYLRRRSQGGTR